MSEGFKRFLPFLIIFLVACVVGGTFALIYTISTKNPDEQKLLDEELNTAYNIADCLKQYNAGDDEAYDKIKKGISTFEQLELAREEGKIHDELLKCKTYFEIAPEAVKANMTQFSVMFGKIEATGHMREFYDDLKAFNKAVESYKSDK